MSVNGGGWVGWSTNWQQLNSVFFLKEKKMQNVLKRKIMYLEGFQVIMNFFYQNNTATNRFFN